MKSHTPLFVSRAHEDRACRLIVLDSAASHVVVRAQQRSAHATHRVVRPLDYLELGVSSNTHGAPLSATPACLGPSSEFEQLPPAARWLLFGLILPSVDRSVAHYRNRACHIGPWKLRNEVGRISINEANQPTSYDANSYAPASPTGICSVCRDWSRLGGSKIDCCFAIACL